jgi:hypothetical protein
VYNVEYIDHQELYIVVNAIIAYCHMTITALGLVLASEKEIISIYNRNLRYFVCFVSFATIETLMCFAFTLKIFI